MAKYEYKVTHHSPDVEQRELNEFSGTNWKMMSCSDRGCKYNSIGRTEIVWMREIDEENSELH